MGLGLYRICATRADEPKAIWFSTKKHTPRSLRGVRVRQKLLDGNETSYWWKTQMDKEMPPLKNDFAFHELWQMAKPARMNIKCLTVLQVRRPTARVSGRWEGWDSRSKRRKLKAKKKAQKTCRVPTCPLHAVLGNFTANQNDGLWFNL
jgi:hypothetical protein